MAAHLVHVLLCLLGDNVRSPALSVLHRLLLNPAVVFGGRHIDGKCALHPGDQAFRVPAPVRIRLRVLQEVTRGLERRILVPVQKVSVKRDIFEVGAPNVVPHRVFHQPVPGDLPSARVVARAIQPEPSQFVKQFDRGDHLGGVFLSHQIRVREDAKRPR